MSTESQPTRPEVNLAPQELTFADARGNRCVAPLQIEVLRALEPADLQALSGAVAAPAQRLLQIRQSHHQLAQLLCEGRPGVEVSLMTGYSPSYISTIQNDPAFAELLSYYSIQREQVFLDVAEQLKTLGLSGRAELQRRIEEAPEKFSNREVMELIELALVKPVAAANAGRGGPQGAGNVPHVQISFVGAGPQEPTISMVDITPRDSK